MCIRKIRWFAAGLASGLCTASSAPVLAAPPGLVVDLRSGLPDSNPDNLTVVGPWLVFDANDGVIGGESWRIDTSGVSASLIYDYTPGPQFTSYPRYHWLGGGWGLAVATAPTYVGGNINNPLGRELWVSDLTPGGTSLLLDLYAGSFNGFPGDFMDIGAGAALFTASTQSTGRALFRTDGTASGTTLVKDFTPGPGFSASMGNFTALDDAVYLSLNDAATASIWRTDGTDPGTQQVAVFEVIWSLDIWNGELVALAEDGVHPRNSIYLSDGQPGGDTHLVQTLVTDDVWNPTLYPASNSEDDARLFFVAYELTEEFEPLGHSVWVVDSPGDAPVQVARFPYQPLVNAVGFQDFSVVSGGDQGRGRAYWRWEPTDDATELWTSDGTIAGTRSLGTYAELEGLFTVGEYCFFVANDGVRGGELWITDGSVSGTRLAAEVRPGAGGGLLLSEAASYYPGFAVLGDRLFFQANDGATGWELWSWQHPLMGDCNGNGVRDAEDIAAGVLHDANRDAAPDECQCLADWNSDGESGVADIFTFLSMWFGDGADVNGDGVNGVPDIFAFLALWFGGCA